MENEQLFSVTDKVVVVTGGSAGIGLMIAETFIWNNARVYISSRKEQRCQQAIDRLNGIGRGRAYACPADLSTSQGIQKLVDYVSDRESRVHVLVNNAGANWGAPFDEYPEKAFKKVLQLNVTSCFMLIQAFSSLLKSTKDDPGRVINVGSTFGESVSSLEVYAYSSSKAALHHLTRHLAGHLAERGITVNCIAPGAVLTNMMKVTLDNYKDMILRGIPLGRLGEASDMGGVCIFLASPAGSYVTGAVIPVDGGSLVSRF